MFLLKPHHVEKGGDPAAGIENTNTQAEAGTVVTMLMFYRGREEMLVAKKGSRCCCCGATVLEQ